MKTDLFDVIIVGGSFSGLSAAMALGRSLRRVLVYDDGKPCNRFTPHAHNLITHDGRQPSQIAALAKEQVARYDTVEFVTGRLVSAVVNDNIVSVVDQEGSHVSARKILFATGLNDQLPALEGMSACWGTSVVHCPYCHGFEIANKPIAILGNGAGAWDYVKLVYNLTHALTVLTNGESDFSQHQLDILNRRNIHVIETPLTSLQHDNGHIRQVMFNDGSSLAVGALFYRPAFRQQTDLPVSLGCQLTETGLIKTDMMQKTSVNHIFAAGDNSNMARSLAMAISSGGMAGAAINRELCEENFSAD